MITVKIFSQDIQKLDLTSFYDLLESLNIIKGALNKNHIFA